MSGSGAGSGRLRAIVGAGRLAESVVSPPTDTWDLPRATVAMWLLTHFCVVVVMVVVVVAEAVDGPYAAAGVILVWLVLLSGLCGRLLLQLVGHDDWSRPLHLAEARRVPWELKLGCFAVASYVAFVAARILGPGVEAMLLATLAAVSGLRVGGLDALAGQERPPLHYVRAVLSVGGALAFGCLVLAAALLFGFFGRVIDPRLEGMETTVEMWLGVGIDRAGQFRTLVVGLVVLTPGVTAMCEALAAVSRYEADLGRRLAIHEQQAAREDIAQDIHDGEILSLLALARREDDPALRRRHLAALELALRRLQVDRHEIRQDRAVRSCLRHPLRAANVLGLDVKLDCEADTLDTTLAAETAALLERLVMAQINNSVAAGAHAVEIAVVNHPDGLRVTYVDDGGGFDPAVIDAAGGGMSRLRFDIERMGGRLWFERGVGATLAVAVLANEEELRDHHDRNRSW